MNGKIMLNGKAYSSSGRPSREVTMSEWLALPDTKYTDAIVYYIKDVGGANQFPPLIYSDEEREIGVWRDGKPLYQKILPFTFASGVSDWTLFNDDVYYDLLISVNGYVKTSNNTQCHTFYSSIGLNPRFCVKNDHKLYYYTEEARTGYVIVQYTKTTDTPGSGTWTTDGTYAKHYSTEEKVVGTWIDGKPIYECTWNFDTVISLPSNTWVNTPISVASKNIKAIIDCEAISSDYDSWGQISAGAGNGAYTYVQLHSSRPQYNSSVKIVTLRYTKTTD